MNSLFLLRASLGELLAIAVLDLFPGVTLGSLDVTDTQFSYTFRFKQPRHPELLILLEEKMRGLLKTEPVFEQVEMATASAVHYFNHKGQAYKAQCVEEADEVIIPMLRVGNFYDMASFSPYEGEFSQIAFSLLSVEEVELDGEVWLEISGTGYPSKDELKAFIKHWKRWLKEMPWKEGERQGLFQPIDDSMVLLQKGVALSLAFEKIWRQAIKNQGFEEVFSGDPLLYPLIAENLRKGLAEWGGPGSHDICYLHCSSKQVVSACISSLQFISETFKILELSANWVLSMNNPMGLQTKQALQDTKYLKEALEACGFPYSIDDRPSQENLEPCVGVELRITDTLGENWKGPYLTLKEARSVSRDISRNKSAHDAKQIQGESSQKRIEYSLFGSIKRLIALMAECKAGKWPASLTTELLMQEKIK